MSEMQWLRAEATIGLPYLRLSGVEQDELSPDIQLKINLKHLHTFGLRADARIENDQIVGADVYGDIQKGLHSAFKRDKMPEWLRVIERARTDARVAAVAGYDLARVFRKVEAMLEETRLLNSFGVHLILNGKIVNLNEPHEWSMWLDQAKQAEWESRITTWRLRNHYAEMRDLGIYFSHIPPFGLTRRGRRHKVEWAPNEKFTILVRGLELVAEGLSCAQVAIALRAEGHTWLDHRGKPAPTEMSIRNWIISLDRYKPFLAAALVYRVESEWARRQNHKANSKRVKHPLPFLRQLVFCAECGRRYFTRWRESAAGTNVSFYSHPADTTCEFAGKQLSAKHLNFEFLRRFAWLEDFTEGDLNEIAARLMVASPAPTALDTRLQREKLELELTNLRRNYNRGDFGDPAEQVTRKFFLAEQLRLQEELNALRTIVTAETIVLTVELAREILRDLRTVFLTQSENNWQKINVLLRTILEGVYVRERELVRVKYRAGWEGLGLDS